MMEKLKELIRKWQEKYKLNYIHADSFNVKWSIKLSFINFLTLLVFFIFIIGLFTYLALVYTPLNRYVFDDVSVYNLKSQLEANNEALLQAEKKLSQQEKYTENIRKILLDEPFKDTNQYRQMDTLEGYIRVNFKNSPADSILRKKVEEEMTNPKTSPTDFHADFYMSPVKGKVSRSINLSQKHYGIDIVCNKDEPVKAAQEGVIIFAGWSSQQGNVIILQHQNNVLTCYKHCSVLLKTEGDYVEVGDPIAVVGNSGELTDGPHLHFEVWQNGIPLNPQEFISF